MRKKLLAAGCLAVLVGGVIFTVLPSAGAGQTLRYRIAFRAGEFYEIDVNENGNADDPGDSEVGEFPLKKHGEVEGHFNFQCVKTAVSPRRNLCSAGIKITGKGSIILADVEKGGEGETTAIVAITGGTGAFRGASGIARLDFRNGVVTFEID